jgi:hypothetical protein
MSRQWPSILIAGVLTAAVVAAGSISPSQTDPIRDEILRWQTESERQIEGVALWSQVQPGARAALAMAREALESERRWLALERLAAARNMLSAALYISTRSAETRQQVAAFEAEWTRVGRQMGTALESPAPAMFATIRPAAARALAETSALQAKILYDASIVYGRATDADSGLFYLGSALAQRELVDLARRVSGGAAPRVDARALTADLDRLERELLRLYEPPASIDRHADFITASAALKEARELDQAGLRFGALFRLLLAAQRVALLEIHEPRPVADLQHALRQAQTWLAADGRDHTIVAMFLERADVELSRSEPNTALLPTITAIVDHVVPAYRRALEPAESPATPVAAEVTVRLVRWPFT